MNQKLLSVIIPVYNTPKPLLEHCLASVKENLVDMEDAEVLLINDGSTAPHIEPVLKDAELSDHRFIYVYKPNGGVSEARNLGIEKAQSEYITFIDADDYFEPGSFRYMVRKMAETNADCGFFGFCRDDKVKKHKELKELLLNQKKEIILKGLIGLRRESYDYQDNGILFWVPTAKIFRKSIIANYHLAFDKKIVYTEDAFFNFQYLTVASQVYLDNRLVYHYITNNVSATQVFSEKRLTNTLVLLEQWEHYIRKNFEMPSELLHLLGFRALEEIRGAKWQYFTHPTNQKSFWQLKRELNEFLSKPIICKGIKELRLSEAIDVLEIKNIILLKLHLYWIFLLTERRKRKKQIK